MQNFFLMHQICWKKIYSYLRHISSKCFVVIKRRYRYNQCVLSWKTFREIKYSVFQIPTLIWRNFCEKMVRVDFFHFYAVLMTIRWKNCQSWISWLHIIVHNSMEHKYLLICQVTTFLSKVRVDFERILQWLSKMLKMHL